MPSVLSPEHETSAEFNFKQPFLDGTDTHIDVFGECCSDEMKIEEKMLFQ